MVYRPSPKKLAGSAEQSEYSFHLVGKKSILGNSASVVGVIATGPVNLLFSDVLGTAFEPSKSTPLSKPAKAAKSDAASKTKGPRRRKLSRTAIDP